MYTTNLKYKTAMATLAHRGMSPPLKLTVRFCFQTVEKYENVFSAQVCL